MTERLPLSASYFSWFGWLHESHMATLGAPRSAVLVLLDAAENLHDLPIWGRDGEISVVSGGRYLGRYYIYGLLPGTKVQVLLIPPPIHSSFAAWQVP